VTAGAAGSMKRDGPLSEGKNGRGRLRISLKSGDRLFINGAVLRADRRVGLEILTEARFLLEQHVMDPAEATTGLRRLYLSVQGLIVEPGSERDRHVACRRQLHALCAEMSDAELRVRLLAVEGDIVRESYFDALRELRQLIAREDAQVAKVLTSAASG